jgi:hypothetical protein
MLTVLVRVCSLYLRVLLVFCVHTNSVPFALLALLSFCYLFCCLIGGQYEALDGR